MKIITYDINTIHHRAISTMALIISRSCIDFFSQLRVYSGIVHLQAHESSRIMWQTCKVCKRQWQRNVVFFIEFVECRRIQRVLFIYLFIFFTVCVTSGRENGARVAVWHIHERYIRTRAAFAQLRAEILKTFIRRSC